MSKQLMIALVACVLGLATIAVGLYVLSQTPAPVAESITVPEPTAVAAPAEQARFIVPKLDTDADDAGVIDIKELTPGTEPWCDAMMAVPDNQWRDEDAKIFAQHCIYLTP